jgi:Gas vesicle protein G
MFLLDSLMISGIQWALQTVVTAAEAEMNDDSALRDRLLEAEMQREMGEISDAEFGEIEADLLRAIREIKERRDGGSGALAFGGAQPLETGEDSRFQIEAEVSGDFYGAPDTRTETDVITITPDAVAEVVLGPTRRSNRSKRSSRSTGSRRSTTAAPAEAARRAGTARTKRAK